MAKMGIFTFILPTLRKCLMTTVETEDATVRHLVSCSFSDKITFKIKNVFLCNESTQLKTFEENYFYLSTNF
jgi:hypothetical protein